MRIIAGDYKGRKIFEPTDKETRPLKDLTKESIFNILEHSKNVKISIKKSNVLDIFAGTGSFSFEALSRGASKATMVENNSLMIDFIYKNAEKLKFKDQITICDENACSFSTHSSSPKFDLVYCDPPYEKKLGIRSVKNLLKKNLLKKNSLIILEEELKSKSINTPDLELLRIKKIGITKFSFFKLL